MKEVLAWVRLAVTAYLLAVPAAEVFAADCSETPSAGVDWTDCSKKNLMLEDNDFSKAQLLSTDLTLTNLSRTDLKGANLEKATLIRAWLTNAVADGANFSKIEAYRAGFEHISAKGASFVGAELQRANFKNADLEHANFAKAELSRVDFTGAALTDVDFSLTNLSRANLAAAIVSGKLTFSKAFMYLTHIEGMDLSGAIGIEQSQIDLACGDKATKLPPGLSASKNWPCDLN